MCSNELLLEGESCRRRRLWLVSQDLQVRHVHEHCRKSLHQLERANSSLGNCFTLLARFLLKVGSTSIAKVRTTMLQRGLQPNPPPPHSPPPKKHKDLNDLWFKMNIQIWNFEGRHKTQKESGLKTREGPLWLLQLSCKSIVGWERPAKEPRRPPLVNTTPVSSEGDS